MALSDLLWACPACGEDRGLGGDEPVCRACGTRFRRGHGASIRATAPDGTETVRSAAEWVEALPDVTTLLRAGEGKGDDRLIREAAVRIRPVTGEAAVHGESGYLNRVEIFGEDRPGALRLYRDRLVVEEAAGGAERGGEGAGEGRDHSWPLEALTAVQASSSSLQLKRRGHPLVAFRFDDDSVFLWERLLYAALRDFYGRTGRGVIVEFQPRIAVR